MQRFVNGQTKFLQSSSTNYAALALVWGSQPTLERPHFDKWKPDLNRGDATLDPNFDLAHPEVRRAKHGHRTMRVGALAPLVFFCKPCGASLGLAL